MRVQIESFRGPKGDKGDGGIDEAALLDTLDRWGVINLLRDYDGAALCDEDGEYLTL